MILITDGDEARMRLHEEIAAARSILPFTGAGISTDAGIPDFRSPGSLWTVNKPIPFAAFVAEPAVRIEGWRRKFAMDDSFAGAQPTSAHHVMTNWVREGRARAVITQNIDGLHQAAGLSEEDVIELHGNTTYARCLQCRKRHELGPIRAYFQQHSTPPDCMECGGVLKSATISFGQAMPQSALTRAGELAKRCDLCLVVGSSLVVYPAAAIPLVARDAGARLVIINREKTALDEEADLVLRTEIAACFPPHFP
ncbi:SIR2 family NAD-dependent protein deacylase [Candidatus Raskinella chloraquaticus]|jgi:NAD-dependent deacetylase|uniref:protein acetyllysine N-acetyltransferase n=1 Tax=Candidatus Raskinella chloraquaticus TaxID=1951219 RepID=A0A1W9I0N9_9HYPH|nr:MAG: NAD-dependent deacetylase [Proteobacteria bacterium SG_bin8]